MTYTPPTPEQIAARAAETKAHELAQHIALHEALGRLIAVKRLDLKPMNRNLLDAEWDYAKAMHNLYSDDCSQAMLDDACAALGVDEDGEPLDGDGSDYADHMNDVRREDALVAQWELGA